MKMNKKTVLLFQDKNKEGIFVLENRLTALLFSKEMAEKASAIIYEEDENYEPIRKFETLEEIIEILTKNVIQFEEINIEFIDYNHEEDD
jgi:hypothetical protein